MGKGRPATTNSLLRNLKKQSSKGKGVVSNMFIPNHSGDHSAGNVSETPTSDNDLVNKKYVDDSVTGTTAVKSVNTLGDNRVIKGDTGGRQVQHTGIIVSDSDDITGVNDLTVDNDLDVKGESKGSRVFISTATTANYTGVERFMRIGNLVFSTDKGMVMPRAGKLVGMSCIIEVGFITVGFSGDFDYNCYKNGSVVYEKGMTVDGTGFIKDFTTEPRDSAVSFVAGDVIALSGVGNAAYRVNNTIICLELQFDT